MSLSQPDGASLEPELPLGPEVFTAVCVAPDCGRAWNGTGTINARRARQQAQRHADRHGHLIDAQHTNPR